MAPDETASERNDPPPESSVQPAEATAPKSETTNVEPQAPAADAPLPEQAPAATCGDEPQAPATGEVSDAAAGEQGEHAREQGEHASEPAAEDDRPKKKRRRRRKRKGAEGEVAPDAGAAGEAPPGAPAHRMDRPDRPREGRPHDGRPPKHPGRGGAKRPSHRPSERPPFQVGEEVFGKVTAVLDTAIMVDLSGKALAIFDRSEMEADDLVPEVSDRFVARIHQDGSRGGLVVLTRKPLREEETKPLVEQAAKDGTQISGLITGVIKGGLEVDIGGIRAFAPASGIDLHPAQANFTALLGQRLDFKVLKYEHAGRDVVITRRPMLEAEAHERRKHALTLLQEGQVMKGIVRTVVEWGAFVQLPEAAGLEGLVHISEASHDPRAKMAEHFLPGNEVEVKIIKIDEKGKIWLSRKALVEDPWAEARQKYASGTRHKGKVTRLEPFGVFVELEQGVDGLIHISDLTLQRIEHPKELLEEGQDIEVVVHHFDLRNKKLGLHPAPKPEHADEAPQKIARNAIVQAEVIKGDTAGVVVRLLGITGRSARGFIPAGQTGTAKGTDLRKMFKPGSRLEAKIIDVDPKRGEPKLSIRGLHEDEERRAHKEYRQKLKQEAHFGTLGDLLRQKLKAGG